MIEWHIITGEYPPEQGGVSDYTRLVAAGLVDAGHTVHVWCPTIESRMSHNQGGLNVHPVLGDISPPDLRRAGSLLDEFERPRRLLVQWVPHGYGRRAMNLPFCVWLWKRAKWNGDELNLMVHETFLPFKSGAWKQNVAAVVQRAMTVVLLNAAQRVWMSIPGWESRLRPFLIGRKIPFEWLPVPSNIPVVDDSRGIEEVRKRYAAHNQHIVGHFGTYGRHIGELLLNTLPEVMNDTPDCIVLLLGRGGESLRAMLVESHPNLASRLFTTGALEAADLSRHMSACDVMLQPYPDGISSRRTSAMAVLSHGVPMVTTKGELTETLWDNSRATLLVPVSDGGLAEAIKYLLDNAEQREALKAAGASFYKKHFDLSFTVSALCNRVHD